MMPRAKRPKIQPNETIIIQLEEQETHVEVWNNPADEGGRGAHMLSKRYKAFDSVLNHCERMLNSSSDYEKRSFTKYVNGDTTIAAINTLASQSGKPTSLVTIQSISIVRSGAIPS